MRNRFGLCFLLLVCVLCLTSCQSAELADQIIFNDWSGFIALHTGESTSISLPWVIFNDQEISIDSYEIGLAGLPDGCVLNNILVTPGEDLYDAKFYTITVIISGEAEMAERPASPVLNLQNRLSQEAQELPLGEWIFTVLPEQSHLQIRDYIAKSSGNDLVIDPAWVLENTAADEVTMDHVYVALPGISQGSVYYDRTDTLDDNEWKATGYDPLVLAPGEKLALRYEATWSSEQFGVFLKPIIMYSIQGEQYRFAAATYESSIALSKNLLQKYRALP